MGRTITAATTTASAAEIARPFLAVELDFASGFTRANSTHKDLTFNTGAGSFSFLGVGNLGEMSSVQEGTELQAYGLTLKLSGVNAAHLSLALGEQYQGRSAKIWLGFLDVNFAVIADPVLIFQGRMDTMGIALGETGEIAVNVESRLADWERPRIRRYTDVDQQAAFPGDRGLEFVAQMVEKELVWGRG